MAHRVVKTLYLWIILKPGCKFKFVCCLVTYLKKMIILGHDGTLQGPYFTKGPLKVASNMVSGAIECIMWKW